jgi:hypothetical protein
VEVPPFWERKVGRARNDLEAMHPFAKERPYLSEIFSKKNNQSHLTRKYFAYTYGAFVFSYDIL